MVKKEITWKKTVITGRGNAARLSEVYGKNWREDAAKDSLSRNVASWRVFFPILDKEKCEKCWLCFDYCPEGVIQKTDSGPLIRKNLCKGCGICATECPFKALTMERE